MQKIVEDATKNPGRGVEFAVSYYNDDDEHRGRSPGYQTMRLVDARSPAGQAQLDQLSEHDHPPLGGMVAGLGGLGAAAMLLGLQRTRRPR